MRLIYLGVLLYLLAVVPRAQTTALAPDSLDVPRLLEYYRVPALSVAVIRDFKIKWARAWGIRTKGYGVVVLTNGDNGSALTINLCNQIAQAAAWGLFDKPAR